MADAFQNRCLQLRAEIGRLRRRTDRHLRESLEPARFVRSVRSIVDERTRHWTPALSVLRRILAARVNDSEHRSRDSDEFEQVARLVAVWLRQRFEQWRHVEPASESESSAAAAEDGVDG